MKKILFKVLCLFVAGVFSFELMCDPQLAQAQALNLPAAGASLALSAEYTPLMVRGMKINPQDGLDLSFIVDTGNTDFNVGNGHARSLHDESEKLIKYFLTALAVPEKDLWVNLSPYEKDRITSDALSQTEMGKDLLAQDYILKKITSSLLFPENEAGKKFWEKVYERMYDTAVETQNFASLQDSIDAFHKIWIMPESAEVFAQNDTVLILNSKLKVMLEEDYLGNRERSMVGKTISSTTHQSPTPDIKSIMREVILPVIENEVNHGENFATLRQIFHGLILAKWFKDNLKQSLLGQVYADQSKMEGLNDERRTTHDVLNQIYQQYLAAFKAGSEGFIKEDYDPVVQSIIAKKYITGGFAVSRTFHAEQNSNAMLVRNFKIDGSLQLVTPNLKIDSADSAMMGVKTILVLILSALLIFLFNPSEQYIQKKAERERLLKLEKKVRAFDERMAAFEKKGDFKPELIQQMLSDFATEDEDKYLLELAMEKDPGLADILVAYSWKIDNFKKRLIAINHYFEQMLIRHSPSRRIDLSGQQDSGVNAFFLQSWADMEALDKEWKAFAREIRELALSDPVYKLVSKRIRDAGWQSLISITKHILFDGSLNYMVIEFNQENNQAMMSSMAKFLAVVSLFATSFFVSPAAGFAQTSPQTYSPEIPYINRNGHLQQFIRRNIGRPLTDYERLFIGHLVLDVDNEGFADDFRSKYDAYTLDEKGIFTSHYMLGVEDDMSRFVSNWISKALRLKTFYQPFGVDSGVHFVGHTFNPRTRIVGVYFPKIPVPRADVGGGEAYKDLADATTKGGIDLDTNDMNLKSSGTMDQAVLQQLPNIRLQDIIGISISNITISPIPSLPKLLGMDEGESEEPEESLAKMELSYLKEE